MNKTKIFYNKLPRKRDWTPSNASPVGLSSFIATDKQERRQQKDIDYWKKHNNTIKNKYPDGWKPKNKLSRAAMIGIKELHQYDSLQFTVANLSEKFKRSPESIRRILKSKWIPNQQRAAQQNERASRSKQRDNIASKHNTSDKHTNGTENDSFKTHLSSIESYLKRNK